MLGSTGLKWGPWKIRYWLMRIAICGDRNLTILKTRGLNFFFNSDLEGSATNMHSNQKLRAVSVLPWDIGEPSELAFWRLVAGPSRYALRCSKQSDQQSATFPVPSLTCMNQYLTYILRPCYKAKRITLFTVHVSTVFWENLSSWMFQHMVHTVTTLLSDPAAAEPWLLDNTSVFKGRYFQVQLLSI
jgi:hypothetical protein